MQNQDEAIEYPALTLALFPWDRSWSFRPANPGGFPVSGVIDTHAATPNYVVADIWTKLYHTHWATSPISPVFFI